MGKIVFSLLVGCTFLSGCVGTSTTEEDFLCDAQLGSPCTTIADVDGSHHSASGSARRAPGANGAVGGGQRTQSPSTQNIMHGPRPIPFEDQPTLSSVPQAVVAGGGLYGAEVVNPVLFREPERVTTVWIAPFVGENGYLYQPGYIHFVVEPGRWFGPGKNPS